MVDICDLIDKNKKYYIYGITALATYCYDVVTEKYGKDIVLGFIQTIPVEKECKGKKIYSVQQAIEKSNDSAMFILAARKRSDEMKKNLKEAGILENAMISIEQYGFIVQYMPDKQVKNMILWPPVEKRNLDLSSKIKWFVPDKITVNICSSDDDVRADFSDAENVDFISTELIDEKMESSDYIGVWDFRGIDSRIEKYHQKVHMIDPNFYYLTELTNYRYLYDSSFSEDEKKEIKQHSLEVFKKMSKEYSKVKRANVFCTGPSIEEVRGNCYRGDFNIICNSMVKDKEFLKNIMPSMLVFGDLAFYLSPNGYCKAFYKDLLETFEKYQYYIAVYDYEVPLIKKHFPMLYDRLIGVERKNVYCFPDDFEVCVKATPNICTLFMIPFASAICDEIGIGGCTGRVPDENYFWEHNSNSQYLDLMHCVFEAYPSFFKYQDYEDYYEAHCKCTEELIEYGETMGKTYINISTSFIPALKKRSIKGREENAESISNNTGI